MPSFRGDAKAPLASGWFRPMVLCLCGSANAKFCVVAGCVASVAATEPPGTSGKHLQIHCALGRGCLDVVSGDKDRTIFIAFQRIHC